jgi:hypothetical protein
LSWQQQPNVPNSIVTGKYLVCYIEILKPHQLFWTKTNAGILLHKPNDRAKEYYGFYVSWYLSLMLNITVYSRKEASQGY